MRYGPVIAAYLGQYVKTKLAYRADFLVESFADLLYQGVSLAFILIVFSQVPDLDGWNREEVIGIVGYFMVAFALFNCLFTGSWYIRDQYIIEGKLDGVMTRPVNPLLQIYLEKIELEPLSGAALGLGLLAYARHSLGIELLWWEPVAFVCLLAGSVLIYGGVFTALAATGFWAEGRSGVSPLVYNLTGYGRYPVTIYKGVVRWLLTWLLPFAFVGFYPGALFLHRFELAHYAGLTPVIGGIVFAAGYWLWGRGLLRYRGAGS
ncbi:ABC transporter permease [Heliobacterium gestii]|uniref:ABC transporter permease n=1 Tax=Heliomicrobium gestii TaxID=2699 RepID=A0A845L9N2_HELGE|nr:ABC-2 family transporter protein [Heliomicrobium gestii]MBM7866290.1 ABC-2 type transport system permease protein [Heliomicrobium gestii]MZP42918.1 ABC transporter permease [Heliomicrobium gestii]